MCLGLILGAFIAPPLSAQDDVEEGEDGKRSDLRAELVQTQLREWVRVKKQISDERADWEAEKQVLADLNDLRRKEIAQMEELIEAAGTRLSDAEKQKAALLAEEETLRVRRQQWENEIGRSEERLRGLVVRFPPVLREKVSDALIRLEAADPEAPLQNRWRDLLAILGEVESFENTITVTPELRESGERQMEVEVVYLGLARAWYVDRQGSLAGVGIPGPTGWQWSERLELAEEIRQIVAMHRKEIPPSFVPLPFPDVSVVDP